MFDTLELFIRHERKKYFMIDAGSFSKNTRSIVEEKISPALGVTDLVNTKKTRAFISLSR